MPSAQSHREKSGHVQDSAIPFSYDIRFDDCEPSAAVRFEIEKQLSRLSRFFNRITDCRVGVRIPHKRGGNRIFHINIQLDVPGKRIAVNRQPELRDDHSEIHLAIHDAFHKLTRQLEDYVKSRRVRKSRKDIPTPREVDVDSERDY